MKKRSIIIFRKTLATIMLVAVLAGSNSNLLVLIPGETLKPNVALAQNCTPTSAPADLQPKVGGVSLDQAATFLADMSDITGAYYDSVNDRIVFVGQKNTAMPNFDKDDLAVAIRAIFFNNEIPAVSIEAKDPSNPWGDPNQKVLYYGGIEDTKFGKTLVDADYKLKMYAIGYDQNGNQMVSSVPGYKSISERAMELNWDPTKACGTRFWISPKEVAIKKDDTGNSFAFERVSMQVQTEPLYSNNDPVCNQAAEEFGVQQTNNYDLFATETTSYFETKQLAKIAAIIKWLKDNNIPSDFQWAKDYQFSYMATPREIPKIISPKISYKGYSFNFGGGAILDTSNTYVADDGTAASLKTAAEGVGAAKEETNWQFTDNGQQYEAVAVAANAFRSLGSYSTSVKDFSTSVAGDLDLSFVRSYSSYSNAQHGMGLGWDILPATLMDSMPGWTSSGCGGTPAYSGSYPWKLTFKSQSGDYESFKIYCDWIYYGDKPEYHATISRLVDGSFAVKMPNQNQYVFNINFQLTQIKDKTGTAINYSYDSSGRLAAITDVKGHALSLSYNAQNLVAEVLDWTGRKVQYGYDTTGNLVSVTDPKMGVTNYVYDSNNKLTQIKDRLGNAVLQNTYTPEAKLATQTGAGGVTFTYAYDEAGKTINISDPSGRNSRVVYDDKARILQNVDALGNSTVFTYGNEYAPLSVTDQRGNKASYVYDANGNVALMTLPNGKTVAYTYDSSNRVTKVTDNRYGTTAKETNFTYDASGNLIQTNEAGVMTSYVYDGYGQILSSTDQLGQTTAYTRDDFGNVLTATDPLSKISRRQYDPLGRLINQTDADGKTASFVYDANNNIISRNDAAGTVSYEYDAENRLKKETLPTGAVTQYGYNAASSLSSLTDALSGNTLYSYDGYQNLTSQQDALLKTTSFSYDALNRQTQETTPMGKVTKWEYDAAGNLSKRTDAAGKITSYSYDALNRLASISYPDGKTAGFSYDNRGNLTGVTDGSGTAVYSYDNFDRLVQAINQFGQSLAYNYDQASNLKNITYPGGKSASYAYDARNMLAGVTDWNGQQVSYSYNSNGTLASKSFPNGIAGYYSYDAANRLVGLEYKKSGTSFAKFTYTRDARGNITQAKEEGSGFAVQGNSDFTYDSLGRLTRASYPDGRIFNYTFDKMGNRISSQENASTTNYNYNNDYQLINTNSKIYQYNENGNLKSVAPSSFLSDENRSVILQKKELSVSGIFKVLFSGAKLAASYALDQFLPETAIAASKPTIKTFTATPATMTAGTSTKLAWSLSGGAPTTLTINQGVGSVLGTTSKTVVPTVTTTYTITATNAAGTVTKSVTVTVKPAAPVISTFVATPASITAGSSSVLSWTLGGGTPTTLLINQNVGSVLGSTSKSVSPATTTTYTLTASNATATVTKQVTVTVTALAVPIINNFTATPSTIISGQSSTLSWTLSGGTPATLTIDNGVGSVLGTTSKIVTPTATVAYTLTASNAAGTATKTVTVMVNPPAPVINTFVATPATITVGASSTLSWTLSGGTATTLTINQGVGSVLGLISKSVSPATTTVYALTATNVSGTVTKQLTVTVNPLAPVISTFTATPPAITAGASSTLSWALSGGTPATLVIDQGVGSVLSSTSKIVSPATTTTYTLTATNVSGTATKTVTVTVNPSAPTISIFTATPATIISGATTTLAWTLAGGAATTLTINQGVGSVLGTTSKIVSPATTTTYTLTATNVSGTATKQITVTVNSPAPVISTFTALPATINAGQVSTLSWTLSGGAVTALTINQGVGSVLGLTSKSVSPATTTIYTLAATNSTSTVTKQITVTVKSNRIDYTWDNENRLAKVSALGDVVYTYDAMGNRLQKTSGAATTRYVNDASGGLSQVLAETDASNTVQNYYLYGNGMISSGPAAAASRNYLLDDGLGNTRFVTDANGNIVQKYDYDPFGNVRSASGTAATNYQFQSQQLDPENGLYFLRARYYDSSTGRFISKDPIKGILTNGQSQNPYQYAYNNPVNLSDPSGKNPLLVGLALAVAYGLYDIFTDPIIEDADICEVNLQSSKNTALVFGIANIVGPGGVGKNIIKAGGKIAGFNITQHVVDRMASRGITEMAVREAIETGEKFRYFHDEVWKIGYFDSINKIFAATANGNITTVINNVTTNYINNLKSLLP